MRFTNPIIPGFAPDPSIVKVADTFFLVNSSFHVFPGLPIYVSKNLQTWELKGHAICRASQLDLSRAFTKLIPLPDGRALVITGGLFAATIRYHKGTFYVICTNAYQDSDDKNLHNFQNFYLTCPEDDILSTTTTGWSDPVYFDFPGIDPSLYVDPDTDKAYIHGSYRTGPPWEPDCSIRQFEIDLATGTPLSEIKFLWKGASADAEGPHIYKKDGWYYLITAEGSTFEGHEINIARSRDIWGPYEGYQGNPLLTASGMETDIQWAGHGDFVQDEGENWFCVHLGIRRNKADVNRHPLGRETFITSMRWEKGEWPLINQTVMEFEADSPGAPAQSSVCEEDIYIRTPEPTRYRYDAEQQTYSLQASPAGLSAPLGTATFVGRRQRQLVGLASTTISLAQFEHVSSDICAGLVAYKDDLRHAAIMLKTKARKLVLETRSVVDMEVQTQVLGTNGIPKDVDTVGLRIVADPDWYSFEFSAGGSWEAMGALDSAEMSGYDMTGTIFGVFATRTDESDQTGGEWVDFESFAII